MTCLAIGILAAALYLVGSVELPSKCEPLTAPMCSDLRQHYKSERMYNTTIYPNSLDHRNQNEAALELHQFAPLIAVKCSKYMKLFLCTVYAPMCSQPIILPCRSLCEEVRNGCLPLMRQFGFKWPDSLKCNKFPRISEKVCFGGPTTNTDKGKGKDKGKTCNDCLETSIDAVKLKELCDNNDIVLVGKVTNIRGDRRVKFRVKQEIKVKNNLGRVIKKRLRQKKMMVKLSFPKKACVGKCKKFENGKTYVVFLKVKKGKKAIYNQPGVILYERGMKIC